MPGFIPQTPENEKQTFSIFKTDDDKRLVFGWASISITVDGEQLEDRQKDIIDPEDLEEAAYEYVLNFRDTGEEHISTMRKKGKLVESCVFTEEKQKAIGIPPGTVPIGWWVGFKIEDDAAWQKVKNGTYKMFSIEGKASREPVEKADRPKAAQTFDDVLKFNPYHDSKGRFASAPGGGGSSGLASMLYGRTQFKEIAQAAQEIIDDDPDHTVFGIRVQEKDTEKVGEEMTHRSKNFGGDFENDEDLQDRNGEELDGVSTIGIGNEGMVTQFGGYDGKIAYLIGGTDYEVGYDPGENIIKDPVVLAKFGYKDGKLVTIDRVKSEQDEPTTTPKDKQSNAPQENPGYSKFMAQMEAKYGKDEMWSKMDDKEFDEAQSWDMHRYDPMWKSDRFDTTAQTFDEIVEKFNPYHDSRGRFASANSYTSFTTRTKDPKKQHWADMAAARLKQQAAAAPAPTKTTTTAQKPAQAAKPATPPKPTKNYDRLGFADHDDADFHQLYAGRKYYQQQNLTAKQQQATKKYLEANPEPGSLYSHSQNMNYMMATGQKLTGAYKQTHDGMMSAMHNLGYNVNLTRYDHAGMVNGLLKTVGAGTDYEKMSASQIKKALVGKTVNENKFLSTSYNDFANAPASTKTIFNSRAVKINYKAKANVQAMMPGVGAGGDFGEIVLAPTNGTANRGGRITDVRLTGQMVRRKGTQTYNQPRIEIDIELD